VNASAPTLEDKYVLERGRVYLTGVQALVRLALLQAGRDRAAGLNTAGFVSGYRGSPLGALDRALVEAAPHLAARDVRFQPGVNEELAATAVWGTQQLHLFPQPHRDGVFAMWYGKGPGVDRCGDVFKHANYAGAARHARQDSRHLDPGRQELLGAARTGDRQHQPVDLGAVPVPRLRRVAALERGRR